MCGRGSRALARIPPTDLARRHHGPGLATPTVMTTFFAVIWMLVMTAGAMGLSAQGAERKNALASIRILKCSFPVSATGSWQNWQAKAEIKPAPDLALQIDEIDIEGGTARVGDSHVTALMTQNSLHFMERTMAGSLTVITVLSQKSPKGTLRAVRSRHDYLQMAIPGFVAEPNVSQHYGECEPVE